MTDTTALLTAIDNDELSFEGVCQHFGADPDAVAEEIGCRGAYGAVAFLVESAKIDGLSSEKADASYAAL